MASEILVEAKDITKVYEVGEVEVPALRGLSVNVVSGEFMNIVGPSGSGKTTLLNCIAAIDEPTSGTLIVGGNDLSNMSRSELTRWRGRHCGYIFQLYHLVPILTAFENVELPLLLDKSLSAKDRRDRVNAALQRVLDSGSTARIES